MDLDPPYITLIKGKKDAKFVKNGVKKLFRRDPTPEKLDLYEFKMTLFENSEPEEFLFFIQHFQMTLELAVTLTDSADIKYICTLLRGEALRQLGTFYIEVGSTTISYLNRIILGLGTNFPCSCVVK